jgi:capsular exopolysaccharide synthesis family protein
VLYNFLNNKITDISEIAKHTKTPLLGTIGHNKFSTNFPVLERPKSTLAEAFRALRTNLNFFLGDQGKKVITVTSTVSGEGKTFIAANLAAIISLNAKKVLLVGLDLRKPKLQNYFVESHANGLSTFLIGRDNPEDIVFKGDIENLYYVPSGPIPPNPAELISSDRMREFIAWARTNFDYVILDTPPIAIVTDALLTQPFADLVLFVVRFNYSNKMVLKLADGLKQGGECKNISLVVNDLQHRGLYGYSYAYSYGYSYGYTYGKSYGYGLKKDQGGYYSDDEENLSWKDRIMRLF